MLRWPDSRESIQGSRTGPLFFESRFGAVCESRKSAVRKRGRSKRGRSQNHANARKRAQISAKEPKRKFAKSAKGRKRAQKSAKERFRVNNANNQV